MEIKVEIEGLERLKQSSRRVAQNVERELNIGLFASAKKIEGDAKRSILNGQKSGVTYKRRTVLHRASAPGEAPASDAGRLVNSINSEVVRGALEAVVKAGGGVVKYARMLEFGTAKMAARPFFHPATEMNRRFVTERLKAAVQRGIQRGGRG